MESNALAQAFRDAETIEEVDELLEDDLIQDGEWVPIGDKNNYGQVFSQQGRPVPAVVELLTNCTDATLRKLFELSNYTDERRFQSAAEAAEAFNVSNEDEEIRLEADGFRPQENGGDEINFTITDKGAGQSQDRFEDTFLELRSPGLEKQEYGFLQGQFGLGSTGVIPFTMAHDPTRGLKFIASAPHDDANQWSWSLVRLNIEEEQFEYFTVDGENAPKFEGTLSGRSFGSVVKVYDYDIERKARITTEAFKRDLNRYVTNIPLEISLVDTRYHSTDDTLNEETIHGLQHKLENNPKFNGKHNRYDSPIEERLTIQKAFDNEHLGTRQIDVYVFKDYQSMDDEVLSENYTNRQFKPVKGKSHERVSVMFTINGQTHGSKGTYFLRQTCGFKNLGKTMLVFIELDDLDYTWKCKLFGSSRSDLRRGEQITKELLDGVEEALASHPTLQRLEDERRVDLSGSEMDDSWSEDFEEFVRRNEATADYLTQGDYSFIPNTGSGGVDAEPSTPPQTFELITHYDEDGAPQTWHQDDGEKNEYDIEVQEGKTRSIELLLDAPDNYLTDGDGTLTVHPDGTYTAHSVSDCTFTLQLSQVDGFRVGDDHSMRLTIDDPALDEPHELRLRVHYIEQKEPGPTGPRNPKDKKNKCNQSGIELPDVKSVTEDKWAKLGIDGEDIVDIRQDGESLSDMTLRVNMDADVRKAFFDNHNIKQKYKDRVENSYLNAVTLLTCCKYIAIKQGEYDAMLEENQIAVETMIESLMKGEGGAIFNLIISDLELDEYTED